ncbi:MAG: D-glycero-beta-D-manno-heptose-7-phosphate kinase [Candidatus Omnitrophota bacterium]|jgi:rfaE bifunctional protein kinase chain/domain|nr:MAG: D-glycero-beta-D-manno-heptose-7-phosphate kinase [Candidatus Omnitrophota bacterium]
MTYRKQLARIIGDFSKVRILVIGDVILDEYIWGNVERISPEAPVPVVWAKKYTFIPGGAANVASNISSLDGRVNLVGVVGKDKNAQVLRSALAKRHINADGVVVDAGRHTTVKTRIIAGHQQVVRLDWENAETLESRLNEKVIQFVKKKIREVDAVIIEDYGKGVINQQVLKEIVSVARAHKKIVNVDPKEDHFQYYRGASCITPNRKEFEDAVKNLKIADKTNRFRLNEYRLGTDKELDRAARYILDYLKLDSILVTLGEHGMCLVEKRGEVTHIPTVAQEVFDVSGAGDTVIAAFTMALCCRATKLQAAHIANIAAGIVVGKIGTAVTDRKELLERLA